MFEIVLTYEIIGLVPQFLCQPFSVFILVHTEHALKIMNNYVSTRIHSVG